MSFFRPEDPKHHVTGGIFTEKIGTLEPWTLLGKQIVGLTCIVLWTLIWSFIIFATLKKYGKLRVSEETELRGNDQVCV